MTYKIIEIIITLFIGFAMGYAIGIFRESLWYSKRTDHLTKLQDGMCKNCIFKLLRSKKS